MTLRCQCSPVLKSSPLIHGCQECRLPRQSGCVCAFHLNLRSFPPFHPSQPRNQTSSLSACSPPPLLKVLLLATSSLFSSTQNTASTTHHEPFKSLLTSTRTPHNQQSTTQSTSPCLISGLPSSSFRAWPLLLTNHSRKDLTSQISDKVTPDSQKSYTEKASENASGAYDKVAGAVQPGQSFVLVFFQTYDVDYYLHFCPLTIRSSKHVQLTTLLDSDKSVTQKAGDSVRSGSNDTQKQGEGLLASAQETVGNAASAASEQVKGAGKFADLLSLTKLTPDSRLHLRQD